MISSRQIAQILEEGETLKMIAQAYTEIAAIKLQNIKTFTEKTRSFFTEISPIFYMVKIMAAKKKIPFNKKGVAGLLITSNQRFYGTVENQLTRFYLSNTRNESIDKIIVGKAALEFFQQHDHPDSYQSILFSQDLPDKQELTDLVTKLKGYQRILVYHPKIKTALTQQPNIVDISATPTNTEDSASYNLEFIPDFIPEPELQKLIDFFDTQVATLILEQSLLESELARTSARFVSMSNAQSNAEEFIKQQYQYLDTARRSLENTQLLETISALTNWRKTQNVAF